MMLEIINGGKSKALTFLRMTSERKWQRRNDPNWPLNDPATRINTPASSYWIMLLVAE